MHEEARLLLKDTVYPGSFANLLIAAARAKGRWSGLLAQALREAGRAGPVGWAKATYTVLVAAHFAEVARKRGVYHFHAHWTTYPALAARAMASLTGLPYSVTTHAFDIFLPNAHRAENLRQASHVVTISEFNRRHLATHGVAREIALIPCGLDLSQFVPAARDRRGCPTITAVGRLDPIKGFSVLIDACALLAQRDVQFTCEIIGEGPQRSELTARIARHALQDRVRLLGALEQQEVRKRVNQDRTARHRRDGGDDGGHVGELAVPLVVDVGEGIAVRGSARVHGRGDCRGRAAVRRRTGDGARGASRRSGSTTLRPVAPVSRAAPVLRLRPSTMTGVLDQAFGLVKAEPGLLLGLGLLASVPSTLVLFLGVDPSAYLDLVAGGPMAGVGDEADGAVVAVAYLALAAEWLGLAVATVGVVHVVESFLLGRAATSRAAFGAAARRLPATLCAWLVVKLIEGVGLLGIGIGAFFMMVFCSVTVPALAFERIGPMRAVRRSFGLVGRRFGYTFGTVVLVVIVDTVVTQVLALPFALLAEWQDNLAGAAVASVGTAAVSTLSAAFVASSAVFLYLELRVRSEGLDLLLEADRIDAARLGSAAPIGAGS